MKNKFSLLCCVLILSMSLSFQVYASDNKCSLNADSGSISLTRSQMSEEQIKSYEYYINSEGKYGEMEVGDSNILIQNDEYTLYVILVSSKESKNIRSSSQVSNKTYEFTEENWLGQHEVIITVDLTCSWISDGEKSRIVSLNGNYTNHNANKYSVEWTDSSYSEITCSLWLKMTRYSTDTAVMTFSSFLHSMGSDASSPYISFSCY